MKKKVNENWDIINKNGHSTFHTGKPGNFNSLREVIWIMPWNWLKMRVSAKKSVMVINILQIMKLLDYTSRHYCRNLSEKLHRKVRNEKLPSKEHLQIQSTEASFYIWSNNQVLSKFYYLLIFSLALIRWNSSHCHLMELFKRK